jgi:hypothetical protein
MERFEKWYADFTWCRLIEKDYLEPEDGFYTYLA